MKILVTKDPDGGEAWLTNETCHSRYGFPLLEITAADVSGIFSCSDIVHQKPDGSVLLGYHIVAGWLAKDRTVEEKDFGERFLSQSPFDLNQLTRLAEWVIYRATGTFPAAIPR